jgi:hypothetical protein
MIINGSNNYTYSGRRRHSVKKVRKVEPVFRPVTKPLFSNPRIDELYKYPSAEAKKPTAKTDQSYKKEISSQYTLAPAYNKGAYMVIPRSEVKDIGR